MSFYQEIFVPMCNRRGVSPSAAADGMGMSKGMVANWKRRGSTPTPATALKVAEYFGITVDELMAGRDHAEEKKEEQPPAKSEELSAMQAALIEYCRNLSESEAAAALQALIALHTARQYPGVHE